MKSARSSAISWIVVALVGCGGAEPSARTEGSSSVASPAPDLAAEGPPASSAPAPSPDFLAGIQAFDAGHFAQARASFEAATKKNQGDYQAALDLGLTCEKLGDKPAAEAAYKAALAAKPDLDTAAENLSALYVDEGRSDDAVSVGRAGLGKHPGSAALHENVGVALGARGEEDAAIQELDQAARLSPSEPMYQLTLAHWLNVGHLGGAAGHLDAARTLAKDDYGMLASIGQEYRMAGAFDECKKTFDHAIALKDGGEVRTERALCEHGMKDDAGMLDDLQSAVTVEPGYAPGHYYLGGRLAVAKRFVQAAAEYAKYLQIAPGGSLAKPAAERLKAAQAAASKDKGGHRK